MPQKILSASLILILATATSANAATIINWGGNYIDAPPNSQPLQGKNSFVDTVGIDADGDTIADDSIGGRLFNETVLFSPTVGYGGTSGAFYGGAITTHQDSTDSAMFEELDIQNQGSNDGLHVHLSSHGHSHDMHLAQYWDQADFLGGGGGPATFDSTSLATIRIGPAPVENLVGVEIRLLVRDGAGNFWLSETSFDSPNSNDSFTWSSANQGLSAASDGNWASYNPNATFAGTTNAGSDLRFDQGSATFASKKFANITGLGYLYEQDTYHNNLDFHIDSFSASANLAIGVPEPSSFALCTFAMIVGTCVRRRRTAYK